MKLNTRIDGRALRHHLSYHWWQYALIVALSFIVWNLIYTQTAYRVPGERRIDLYVQTVAVGQEAGLDELRAIGSRVAPEAEEVNVITLLPPSAQDMYANVQLVTFLSAREGDIYVLGTEDFKRFAAQGAFLDEAVSAGTIALDPAVDLRAGHVTVLEQDDNGKEKPLSESRLYGIPLSAFPTAAGLLGLHREDMFLSVTHYSDNLESTLAFVNQLLKR